MTILGAQIIQKVDTVPFEPGVVEAIASAFQCKDFSVVNAVHHLSVRVDDTEFAVIYLDPTGKTVWIRALAQRWWLLFLAGDRQERFDLFWQAVDQLQPLLSHWKTIAGTVGELTAKQLFEDTHGRTPTQKELAQLEKDLLAATGKALGL